MSKQANLLPDSKLVADPTICPDCDGSKTRRALRCSTCARRANRSTGFIACPKCNGPKSRSSAVCKSCVANKAAQRAPADSDSDADKLRRENGVLRADVGALRQSIGKLESRRAIEDTVAETLSRVVTANPYMPRFEAPRMDMKRAAKHEMLLLVSDAHFPEVVDPRECFGQSYGPEQCRLRMRQLRDATMSYIARRDYEVKRLTIGVVGDMLSGDIHEELIVTNAEPMAQAVVDMAHMLFELGSDLAAILPVRMVVMPGNHPRMTKKPTAKYKWNNHEHIMGHMVRALARDAFEVEVPRDLVYRMPVFDKVIGLTHGDGVKTVSFAGIPHYSLQRRRNALQQLLRETGNPQLDLLCYGHFHQLIYDDLQGVLINGSIKGTDEFGAVTRYAYARPTQALVTFHGKALHYRRISNRPRMRRRTRGRDPR